MAEEEQERRAQHRASVGRIVHFYPYGTNTKVRPFPFVAAIITDVHPDGTVNVMTFPPGSGPASPGQGPVPSSFAGVPQRGVKVEGVETIAFWEWPPRV